MEHSCYSLGTSELCIELVACSTRNTLKKKIVYLVFVKNAIPLLIASRLLRQSIIPVHLADSATCIQIDLLFSGH